MPHDRDGYAAVQLEMRAAQQAIRETKRDIDFLRLLSWVSIFLGILALSALGLVWGME